MKQAVQLLAIIFILSTLLFTGQGCANIIPPGGGPRDSIPPRLISATPPDSAKNVKPAKITLTFDEYVAQLQNVENIIISPTLATTPSIESHLKTVTVKLKEALEPNTTYSINFGNSIRDINEGNVTPNFTYVFSTGNTIDQNTFSGKVILAETGQVDSTLIVVLHRNLADSAIQKLRPLYYTRIDGSGNFIFNNLPAGNFNVYALANDYSKRYDDSTKRFAFLNTPVTISAATPSVTLYAYEQAKRKSTTPPASNGTRKDNRLRYSNTEAGPKDIFTKLTLEFTKKLKRVDTNRIILTDTSFHHLSATISLDTTATKLNINHPWKLNSIYKLIIPKDAVADVDGVTLLKSDTLTFTTKRAEDYGQVKIRFTNVDLSKNPVLQIIHNNIIVQSVPLTSKEWKQDMFKPGDYDLRILYDENKNGVWDPGNFKLKKQPETVQAITRKLTVKGNWENEVDITL